METMYTNRATRKSSYRDTQCTDRKPPGDSQNRRTAVTFLLLAKNAKRRDEICKKLQQLSTL